MEKVSELFECICCQELLYQPVTTKCAHNFCKVRVLSLVRLCVCNACYDINDLIELYRSSEIV